MPFLEINNVRKAFGQSVAVDTFNLHVERGEFISFLGPSGCGKTTTLRMVAGFEQPTSGQIVIDGQEMTHVPANRRNIGMVFQSYGLFPNMTVANNIIFGMKIAKAPADLQKKRLGELLGIIGMAEFGARYPHQLSGGQQQRVALARALAIQPHVLLLDEPLSALDAKIRVSLRQEIRSIQRQLGITTIYVTHDQEEALSISDRIVVMNKGKVEQVGRPPEIYNTPQTQFVATFVGTLNVLTAHIVNAAEKCIALDGQQLRIGQALDTFPADKPLSVTLRPESLTLSLAPDGHANSLRGTIEDIYFLGSVVRIRVRLTDQAINVDMFNNPNQKLPDPGADMVLNFPLEACMPLRAN